jgi:glycosyltransferase involved in cell wall biosynthesis
MQIFYDISLSRKHLGNPHGMARVEVAIARELLEMPHEIKPIWLKDSLEIATGELSELRSLTDGGSTRNVAFPNYVLKTENLGQSSGYLQDLRGISSKDRVIVIVAYIISLFPVASSKFFWSISKKSYSFLSKVVRLLLRRGSNTMGSVRFRSGASSLGVMKSDSLILIPGNDWDRRILDYLPKEKFQHIKVAAVVYDLIPYDYPHYSVDIETSSRFTYWIGYIAQRSDFLFFISRFSQNRFNTMLNERGIESKAKQLVLNLPPGIMPSSEMSEPEFRDELSSRFVLVVGTIESRKNHQILVSALRLAISRNEIFPQLVFIGSPGWGTQQLMHEIYNDEDLKRRVIVKSGILDSELRWLYENCAAIAYPSVAEGFGLPVLEAAVFKKPVITSDILVFDEIAHPFRTKVNPYDTEGWKAALQNVGSEPEPLNGWKELRLPTWKENVQQMITLMSK